ncbi:MAG: GNAT family N-acetyltransferase [Bacillota bacterium]
MITACRELIANQIVCDKGTIVIEGPVRSEHLEKLEFDENLSNFRKASKQKKCLCEIAGSNDGFIYIANYQDTVIGYVTYHRPDSYTRWHRHPLVLELGAIEVSPLWRKYKVGRNMLIHSFANPVMKDYIVITMEYCWHWDLENNKMNVWQYQKMLTRLFGTVSLQKVNTDDPEILENPANVLMARIGEHVPAEYVDMFEKLKFLGRK